MIERPWASVLLSLLVVAVATIILPRSPRPAAEAGGRTIAEPLATPAIAWEDSAPPREDGPPVSPSPSPSRPRGARPPSPTAASPVSPGFARVLPGETLEDIAERVYGPGGDSRGLWEVNRDQLATLDSVLQPGTILRAPPRR